MPKPMNVISQWCQLIENFQASSQEFYNAFEMAVATRAVPQIHWTRVVHKEGGIASASREYLRMHRGKTAFDICAAPFGTGFFVSWWFTEPPLRFGFLYTLLVLAGTAVLANILSGIGFALGALLNGITFGAILAGAFMILGTPAVLWLIGSGVRNGVFVGESTLLAVPLIGWIYERIFAPPTFYSMDTAIMFQQAVHNAVLEVVDGITQSKGVRALTESERKPVMKRFAASV